MPEGENKTIASLLIDAPGGKTVKDNLDHFIKSGRVNQLCPSCATTALFTLQTNAPAGGVGHRVSLRGGGPLTTLVVPKTEPSTLWKKTWLNIFNQEAKEPAETLDASVFPWLAKTRTSEKKGQTIIPLDVHWLQAYWGMPRRIRLTDKVEHQQCDLCGGFAEQLFTGFCTKNYGINYDGAWVHPLTPYRFDPKHKELPLSLKGQQGGLVYRHWLGLALQDNENGDKAAEIVQFFNNERGREIGVEMAAIWCFGYDMDNMKARCWYESRFPVFYLDRQQQNNLMFWASELINAARESVKILRTQIKEAWFNRPKDAKGDMSMIDRQFWEQTEADFFRLLEQLARLPGDTGQAPPDIYRNWLKVLQREVFQLFESTTLASVPEGLDLKRIIVTKNGKKHDIVMNAQLAFLKTAVQELDMQTHLPSAPGKSDYKKAILATPLSRVEEYLTQQLQSSIYADSVPIKSSLKDKLAWALQANIDEQMQNWFIRQGEKRPNAETFGFSLLDDNNGTRQIQVTGYQWHALNEKAKKGKKSGFSSVDLTGKLQITDLSGFEQALFNGIGRAKAFGCGLLMIRKT